jgi:hypothetical protein
MIRIAFAAAVLAACWRTTPPAQPPTPQIEAPTVRLAVANRNHVMITEVSATGIAVKYQATLGSSVTAMYWAGADPVVQLLATSWDEETTDDSSLDGTIGRITEQGFVAYPALPPSTWTHLDVPVTDDTFEVSWWNLVVTPTNEVWQGRCKRAKAEAMDACVEWAWARIDVPGAVSKDKPAEHVVALPVIQPSPRTLVAFVPFQAKDDKVERMRLHCEHEAERLDYPSEADLELGMSRQAGIRWISTTPPVFQAVHRRRGFRNYSELVVFEGCAVSRGFQNAELIGGPGEMIAMFNRKKLSVRWRGHELGTLPGATIARFARSTLQP